MPDSRAPWAQGVPYARICDIGEAQGTVPATPLAEPSRPILLPAQHRAGLSPTLCAHRLRAVTSVVLIARYFRLPRERAHTGARA
ncbi:hypothetical protein NDU88_007192 [Pleurodeles waltl]|uniref:Uncharacterized protein n=1 Tax=Pleurodeles waltl TaxID=8319 RepID=A0AAV7MJI9_PLEWA|nr:hypothetical protein NDU88_007192 [Pleurodeles waltl]